MEWCILIKATLVMTRFNEHATSRDPPLPLRQTAPSSNWARRATLCRVCFSRHQPRFQKKKERKNEKRNRTRY